MVRLRKINKASTRIKSLQLTSSKTSSRLPGRDPSQEMISKSQSKTSKQSPPPPQNRIVFNLEREGLHSKRNSTIMDEQGSAEQGSGEQLLLTQRPIYTQEMESQAKFQTAKEIVKHVLGSN
mmetsp:Transcript_31349/g.47936  ORF Transcript_31349/g.47936 Transcript_31349/m.47936 type:complete len:122 (+) Transcript_31349:1753-2118(+)